MPLQVHSLFQCVGALLHLSNVTFVPADEDGSTVAPGASTKALGHAATLLGLDASELATVFTSKRCEVLGCSLSYHAHHCLPFFLLRLEIVGDVTYHRFTPSKAAEVLASWHCQAHSTVWH